MAALKELDIPLSSFARFLTWPIRSSAVVATKDFPLKAAPTIAKALGPGNVFANAVASSLKATHTEAIDGLGSNAVDAPLLANAAVALSALTRICAINKGMLGGQSARS